MRTLTKRMCATALGLAVMAIPAVLATTPAAEAGNGTTVRPVSDFLQEQTFGDIVDWISDATNKDAAYRARVDFLGIINENYIKGVGGKDLGTSFTGTVTERVRTDGRTEVHVVVHGKDVLFFAFQPAVPFALLAGRPAPAFLAGLDVDTCSTRYDLKYITPNAPGQTMPRLGPLLFDTPENWEVLQSKIVAQGDCELRAGYGVADGTPARFSMNMVALMHPKGGDVTTPETFPTGYIRLREVGN